MDLCHVIVMAGGFITYTVMPRVNVITNYIKENYLCLPTKVLVDVCTYTTYLAVGILQIIT